MRVRAALRPDDDDALWAILQPVLRAGESYALPHDIERSAALDYWCADGNEVHVAVEDSGAIVGTYYLRANRAGGGDHVANCGYMTAPWAQRRGVARTMAQHSLDRAAALGFLAMQFNFVVETNERAVALWSRLGFDTIGRIPAAFRHPRHGLVGALVMHRALDGPKPAPTEPS